MLRKVLAGGHFCLLGAIYWGRVTLRILGSQNCSEKQRGRQAGLTCELKMVLACQFGLLTRLDARNSTSFNLFHVTEISMGVPFWNSLRNPLRNGRYPQILAIFETFISRNRVKRTWVLSWCGICLNMTRVSCFLLRMVGIGLQMTIHAAKKGTWITKFLVRIPSVKQLWEGVWRVFSTSADFSR